MNYDLAILRKYEKKWNRLKYIVLPVDYLSLFQSLEWGDAAVEAKNYNIYYDINYSGKIEDNAEMLSNGFRVNVNRLYGFYCKNNSEITCNKKGWGTTCTSQNKKDLEITGKAAAIRHTASNDQFFNDNHKMLKEVIEFAKQRSITVLLITTPAYKTYIENLDKTQLRRTIDAVSALESTNENVCYFNLLSEKGFTEMDFFDADHFNEFGAKKYTLFVDSLLMAIDKHIKTKNLSKPI